MNWVFGAIVVAVLVGGAFMLGRWRPAGTRDQADAAAMPAPWRTFLAVYFVALAGVLVYSLLALYSADFADPQITAVAVPELSAQEKEATLPGIKQLDPPMLIPTIDQPQLKVHGYGFTAGSRIRLNRSELQTAHVSGQMLTAPIRPSDYLGMPAVLVDVVNNDSPTKPSAAVRLPVHTQSAEVRWFTRTWVVTREVQLLLLVVCAGALGSYLHAVQSLTDYIGNRQLTSSWFWFYVTRPFLGMALAIVFYAAIRGGFVAGSPADVKSVNPFGVVALAALVGMFSDTATQKLKEVFTTLFKTSDNRLDKLAPLDISTAALPDATTTTAYKQPLKAAGGKPPYTWSAEGLPAGLTLNTATATIEGTPTVAGDVTVAVTLADSAGAKTTKNLALKVK